MSNTSKADLCAEIAAVCQEQGKPLPEGLEGLKQVPLFDLLESLTGKKDPRRPAAPAAGAVRASVPPDASAKASDEPAASAPKKAESSSDEAAEDEEEEETEDEEEEETEDEEEEETAPAVAVERGACPERCVVAEGKVVHCLRGPVGAFEYIREMDLGGGREELEKLFADGTVVAQRR